MMTKEQRRAAEAGRTWRTYPAPTLIVGDRVAYSIQFLRSIMAGPCDEMRHARGTVQALEALASITLAVIKWDDGDFPGRVNIFNLAKVGPNPRFCNID